MRKRLFTILIAIATCVVVLGQEEMVFTPQWTAQAQFAGYYVALEKGFYKREGLKVHIEHPYASNSCINMLKRGECQLITQPLISAIRQIDKGLHLVNLQQTSQNNSEMIISNRPIKSIKSLNGLRIGHWKAGYSELAFIMAQQHGLRIEWIPFVQNVNLFISGAIDATMAMSYNEYFQLRMSGIKIPNDHMFCFADYGYNIPEDGLYVTADYYATHKTAVDKFVKATREGWEWAAAHPEETLEIVMKMTKIDDVKTNKLVQRWMLNDFLKNMTNKKTGKRSYRLTPEALELANKLLLMSNSIKKPVTYQQITQL